MRRFLISVLVSAAFAISASGCGSGKASAPTSASSTATAAQSTDPTSTLDLAVREALRENYQLSGYVLWHNVVPSTAQRSTRGPALAGLRSAAVQRRQQGVRIRAVTGRLTILSVVLDPSFATATATTLASGRVRPYQDGHPGGHDIAVHERARVQLRRLGHTQRFVVWQVTLVR